MIGLFPGVKMGDSLLDSEFVVLSRQGELARSYLRQPAVGQSLLTLFEQGFWTLVMDKHCTWTEKLAYDRKLDLDLMRFSAVLRCLKTIATGF